MMQKKSFKAGVLAKALTTTVIACSCLAILGSLGVSLYARYSVKQNSTNVVMSADEVQTLIQKVSAHIAVKAGEQPTVATIQDAEILRAQNPEFYRDAQSGDRLLIWSDKAVLFSTKQDKLLAVLPIRLPTPAVTPTKTK